MRGAAIVDAAIPRRLRPPDNDPVQRLALYLGLAEKSKVRSDVQANVEALRELKYPVTVKQMAGAPRPLNDDELAELLRWVDTLDRI